MKLISQIGGYGHNEPPRKSTILKSLRSIGRRIPWSAVGWCLFAVATLLVALKAVSLMAAAIKTVGAS